MLSLKELKEAVLDILYPQDLVCAVCAHKGSDLNCHGICTACKLSLPFILPPACKRCGKPVAKGNRVCPGCDGISHYFEQAVAVFEYSLAIQRLIYRYKYNGETFLCRAMGSWMSETLTKQSDWRYDIMVPVPLHPKRQAERGFNQAGLLAANIASIIKIPVIEHALVRSRDTFAQATLDRQQRVENLKHAFEVKDPAKIKGAVIILVDDIYTTGSTADQCSRILLEAGAKRVYVLTLATGRNI